VPSVAQSIALHDTKDIWTVVLPIELEIVSTSTSCIQDVYYFWAIYRAMKLPLRDEQSVHLRFIAVKQDRADQDLVHRCLTCQVR
jgi:hypothetical protein